MPLLKNIDGNNVCYANSVINFLYSNPLLQKWVLDLNCTNKHPPKRTHPITRKLYYLLKQCWDKPLEEHTCVNLLNEINKCCSKKNSKGEKEIPFELGVQGEVNDFYRFLVEQVAKEQKSTPFILWPEMHLNLESVLQCNNCPYERKSIVPPEYLNILTNFTSNGEAVRNLQRMIDLTFYQTEDLDDWRCENCNKTGATKSINIINQPDYLVFYAQIEEQGDSQLLG
jgi:ubiquitin C-terminal hydrolase